MTDNHIRHKAKDPRVTCSISLPESLWVWIEEQGANRSAVVERAVGFYMQSMPSNGTAA